MSDQLKRYEPSVFSGYDTGPQVEMEECADGEFVRLDDLRDILKEAARYRYLRATTKAIRNDEGTERIECTPEQFDAAVDAGMARAGAAPAHPAEGEKP